MSTSLVSSILVTAAIGAGAWFAFHDAFGGPDMSGMDFTMPKPVVTGTLKATGTALGGDWTLEAPTCASGQRMQFHGVDVGDTKDTRKIVRIVDDPVLGELVKVNVLGSSQARIVTRKDCSTFELVVRPTNTFVNTIRLFEGSLTLACRFDDGGTLAGHLDFSQCD